MLPFSAVDVIVARMVRALAVAWMLLGTAAGPVSAEPAPRVGKETRPRRARAAWTDELRRLEQTYGLSVEYAAPAFPVATTHGQISGRAATGRELDRYVPLFLEEFGLYPADLVRRTGLRRIVLCKSLAFAGEPRASIPDYDHTVMYYDVARAAYSEAYQRATIHHEFFHMLDWKDDRQVYEDAAWSRINRDGFVYGPRHVRGVDPSLWGQLDESLGGFLNRYSMTGVQEDKAEIFCYLMTKPEMIQRRARNDAVLGAKVEAMKRLTASFSASADEAFWRSIAERRAAAGGERTAASRD
jgi:hypothetical protein